MTLSLLYGLLKETLSHSASGCKRSHCIKEDLFGTLWSVSPLCHFPAGAVSRTRHADQLREASGHPPSHPALRGGELRPGGGQDHRRSEEHTSELQSRPHLVCRLL